MMTVCNAFADNLISPVHPNIKYVGRTAVSYPRGGQEGAMIRFSYPGTQIRAIFEGNSIKMLMKPNSGYFMVELDDKEPYKIHSSETDSILVVAENLSNGKHSVCITMVNEGYRKKPEFYGFILDDGANLPEAPQLPSKKIEFIGNSITCGYGIEGKSEKEHFSFATENQYYSYDAITARNLNAQAMIVARSGIGIYRNCGGKVTGDKIIMPAIYPYTLYNEYQVRWDFSQYIPDVVCINLGTNDTSYSKCDTTLFVKAFYGFLHTIRKNYPDAKIVILSGTMITKNSKRDKLLRGLLDKTCAMVNDEGDKEVYRFDLTPEDGTFPWGSDYHPSMQRQKQTADELTAYLRKLMNW